VVTGSVTKTDSDHDHPIAPNLLEHDFRANGPNQNLVTDITYIPTGEGWLSLAAIINLFSRRVVGWAMDAYWDRTLVQHSLDMVLRSRVPACGLIHHRDRGRQYASEVYRHALTVMGITASMSRRGNGYDNAVIESFWNSLKNELVHRQDFTSRAEAMVLIIHDIE
jgi:putative transposase